jgi:heme-degrading monooxygenase HmoA
MSRKMKAPARVRSQIQGAMIARLWRGYSTPEKANGYRVILLRQILPHINKSQGYGGSFVLERTINGEVEFLIITLWESMDAVRQFAGPKYERAVIHEEAAAFLTRYDTESIHYLCHENK